MVCEIIVPYSTFIIIHIYQPTHTDHTLIYQLPIEWKPARPSPSG